MLKLISFLQNNPDDWEEKLTSPPYCLKIKKGEGEYEGLILFKYSQFDSDFSNPIVQEARGIILDAEDEWRVVRMSFRKFFNYAEEEADDIDWKTARVQEKVDGSLMSVSYWSRGKKWLVSSNGEMDAGKYKVVPALEINGRHSANTLKSLFYQAWYKEMPPFATFEDFLDKNKTYTFELVSPYNKVVISYPETYIYHLATRNNDTLQEENVDIGIPKPEEYYLRSIEEVIWAAKALNRVGFDTVNGEETISDVDYEGYVVVDANYNRIKVKSPLYLAASYLIGGVLTFKKAFNIVYARNEEKEYISYFPEKKPLFQKVHEIVDRLIETMEAGWKWVEQETGMAESQKEFAEFVKDLQFSDYYLQKRKISDLTPKEFLFGGRKFWSTKKKTWSFTPPHRALSEYVTKFYLNEDASDNWRF